jgi:tetratricopeptide (TPR) repeat protein
MPASKTNLSGPTGTTRMALTKQQALAYFKANRLGEAKAAYKFICANTPNDPDAWLMLGVIHGQLGELAEAEHCNRQLLSLQPTSVAGWDNLGIILMLQGKVLQAKHCFNKALEINPNATQVLIHLGNLSREQGKADEAMRYYQNALQKNPDSVEAYNNIGNIFQDRCKFSKARDAYKKALQIKPDYLDACFNMGAVMQKLGKHKAAAEYYQKALKLRPGFTEAIAALADVDEKQGNYDQALQRLTPLISFPNPLPSVAATYGTLCRRLGRQHEGCNLIEKLINKPLPPIRRQELLYVLGDMYDDLEQYNKAFEYYQLANQSRPSPNNCKQHREYMLSLATAFSATNMPKLPRATQTSSRPVFIVGMPRSGTSLVEQILASHSGIHGAGELPYMAELLSDLPGLLEKGIIYPEDVATFTGSDMNRLAAYYGNRMDKHSKSARLITDKMPHNFLHLGLIELLFPDAHIIHCRRNPLDTCLSIYFHNFNANHPYANDLVNLGAYYRAYEELMKHWRSVLNIQLLDVDYERLISNQEEVTRELLEFCNMDWDPNCLKFHETGRIVNTPSYDQVRRPIYKSSIGRWKNYSSHLDSLKDILDLNT